MSDRPPAAPLRAGRLAVLVAALASLAVAAFLVLPVGLFRLAVPGLLMAPVAALLIDRPRWVLYGVVFVLFSNIDIFFPFRMFLALVLFLIAVVVLRIASGRRMIAHDPLFLVLVSAFLISSIQAIAFALDLRAAIEQVWIFVRVLVITLLIPQLISRRKELVSFFTVIAAGVLLSAFLPLAVSPPEAHASRALIWGEGVLRYEGYVGEANFFAYHLVFLTPLLLFLFARFPRPRWVRPLILAALGGVFYVLALSFSRGGFVSMAAAIIALFAVERHNRALLATGLVAMTAALIAVPAVYWDRISTLIEAAQSVSADYAVLIRYETMRVALMLGASNPLFGVGPNNFILQAGRFIPYVKDVHNVFLQVFAELGVPGLAALLVLVVRNFRLIGGMMRRTDDPEAALLGRMLFVHHCAVLVNTMFIPVAYGYVLWITLVLPTLARRVYLGERRGPRPPGIPGTAAGPASR